MLVLARADVGTLLNVEGLNSPPAPPGPPRDELLAMLAGDNPSVG